MTAPGPPWRLRGDGIAALVRPALPDLLPVGIERLPGPSLLVAAHYASSPVGPYLELVLASPARVGPRPGVCVTTMAVDSHDSVVGGRSNWGFPKELSSLRWAPRGDGPALHCEDRGMAVAARPRGPALPLVAPVVCLQRRGEEPVLVAGWVRGRFRSAQVDVEVDAATDTGDPLQALAGRHRGLLVTSLKLVVSAARPVS